MTTRKAPVCHVDGCPQYPAVTVTNRNGSVDTCYTHEDAAYATLAAIGAGKVTA